MNTKSKEPTQRQLLLAYLLRYGSIEPLTALSQLGIYRLGARVKDLRDDGWDIATRRVEGYSKFTGRKIQYAQYILMNHKPIAKEAAL